MSAATSFIHPTLGFYALALVLPFLSGKAWKWLLLIPPVVAIWSVLTIEPGMYGQAHYLGQTLLFGRVDKLSLVFAQVFDLSASSSIPNKLIRKPP